MMSLFKPSRLMKKNTINKLFELVNYMLQFLIIANYAGNKLIAVISTALFFFFS